MRRVVDKLLHTPTVQVKRLAEGPDGSSYAHALRELFELDPQAPAAVAVQRHGDVLAALEAPMQTVREMSERPATPASPHPQACRRSVGDRSSPTGRTPRLGTRPSALAVAQSELVAQRLRDAGHTVELVTVSTSGDRSSAPIATLGVGVFVSQLRDALVAEEVDLAVHSYKDLPTAADPRLVIAAVPPREDPRDALVARDGLVLRRAARRGDGRHRIDRGASPSSTPSASACAPCRSGATSTPASARSAAGSSTRWSSPRPGCVASVASTRPAELLDPLQMLPAPAQGALAVECRAADTALAALLAQVLDDADTRAAVTAERAVLATLEAGCSAPVGALADVVSDLDDDGRVVDRVFLRAVVGTGDGALLRASATGDLDDAEKLGAALAAELLDWEAVTDPPPPKEAPPRPPYTFDQE